MRTVVAVLLGAMLAVPSAVARAQSVPAMPEQTTPAQTPVPKPTPTPTTTQTAEEQKTADRKLVFKMGEIVVVGTPEGVPGIGRAVVTRSDIWKFDRNSLDQAANLVPGVVSTFDSNGRRNESDIFVRGFGRWQVPLTIDGVRIYLPADNRLDYTRFLTADIAEVQVQKGYASVIDGPGAMGGAINLVTRKPVKAFEIEGSVSAGGRSSEEGWSAYAMLGTRQPKYYVQGSTTYSDRDFWTLSGNYQPTVTSLQQTTRRQTRTRAKTFPGKASSRSIARRRECGGPRARSSATAR